MTKDDKIHVYFVELDSLVNAVDFNLQFNGRLFDALKNGDVYRIEILAGNDNTPVLKAAEAFLFHYTLHAVHSVQRERMTADDLQEVVRLFPDFLGGRWNWMYIGKDKRLAEAFGIKRGDDFGFTN